MGDIVKALVFVIIGFLIAAAVYALVSLAGGRDVILSLVLLVFAPVLATLVWDWYSDEND